MKMLFSLPMVFTAFFSFPIRVLVSFSATAPMFLAHADDWNGFVFDLNNLIWMLVGALGWGSISYWLGRRSVRRIDAPSAFVPKPASAKPAKSAGPVGSGEKDENISEYLTPLDETTTVTVEELSSIVEQVDLFLLLGRHDVAISMLLDRIGIEGDGDPRVWFKLLDIYYARGDSANFEKLANSIHVRFNVALPSWEDCTLQAEGRHGLEHFPHLLARISDCWGSSASLNYLQSLMKDNRSGERTGFNEDAFREVMFLISILEQEAGPQ